VEQVPLKIPSNEIWRWGKTQNGTEKATENAERLEMRKDKGKFRKFLSRFAAESEKRRDVPQ